MPVEFEMNAAKMGSVIELEGTCERRIICPKDLIINT